MLVMDCYLGYIWDYNLTDCTGETIVAALADLLPKLNAKYRIIAHAIEYDNKIYIK
jgi:hypothetical protein